jgi:hypothetical protein
LQGLTHVFDLAVKFEGDLPGGGKPPSSSAIPSYAVVLDVGAECALYVMCRIAVGKSEADKA